MKKGDIMYGGRRGDSFLQKIAKKRSFLHIHERIINFGRIQS